MYIEEIGIIRAKEANLLTFPEYERLVNMVSFRDLYTELVRLNIGYEEIPYNKIPYNISSIFSKNIVSLYREIIPLIKEEKIKKAFLYEFDFFNLKLIFKYKFYNNKKFLDNLINLGFIGKENIVLFFEKDILIPEEKNLCFDFNDIFNIIKNNNHKITPFEFDIFLDKILMNFRLNVANTDFSKDLCKKNIDFINIKLFLNNSSSYLDYGYISSGIFSNLKLYSYEEKINIFKEYSYEKIANIIFTEYQKIDFLDLELEKERILLEISQKSIFFNFSIEPIICYIIKKLCEIKVLNRLLNIKTFLGNNLEKELKIIQNYKERL